MIYVHDNAAGYLLNEGILRFTDSRVLDTSARTGPGDVLLHCRYLHNHTRFRLANGDRDYETMSRNTNEMGMDEPIVLDDELREVLAHENGYLFLCNTWESFPLFSHTFQEGLEGLLNHVGIPPERVIVSCCDAQASVCPEGARVQGFGFDWACIRERLNFSGPAQDLATGERSRHFIFLNRRYTPDRFLMLLYITHRGLRDRFHLSFLSRPTAADLQELSPLMDALGLFGPDTGRIEACVGQALEELPLVLDGARDEIDWGSPEGIEDRARDACFFLVNETMPFWDDRMFISEKTYKPIRLGMPFIVFGPQGTLAHLRDLGFETFAPLVDERYDEEPDPVRRLSMVMREVERLCGTDIDEARRVHSRLVPVLEHNLRLLQGPGRIPGLEEAIMGVVRRRTQQARVVRW